MRKLVAGVVALLLLAIAVQTWRVHRWQARHAEEALARSNDAARADTTRMQLVRVSDSLLTVYRLLAVQEKQRGDALDRALGLERIANANLRATIRGFQQNIGSSDPVVVTPDDERVADFHVRQPPYTVDATATLPPPPRRGSLALSVALDPVPLGMRLGCAPANAGGIRAAEVSVVAPPWARVQLDSVSQSPELCRSPALERRGGGWLWKGAVGGAGGYALARILASLIGGG